MPSPESTFADLPDWMDPGDPWLPRKMQQYKEMAAAEAELGPEVEKALAQLLAEARKYAGRSWAGRARFWATVLATVLFGPLAGLFVNRFTQEVARITIRERPDPEPYSKAFLDQVAETLAAWPDAILAEADREQAEGRPVDELLDINAPSRKLRAEMARLRETIDDPATKDSVRREARARLAALQRRDDRTDRQWWPWVAAAVRNLALAALNAGTFTGADAYTEATGERRYKQWWSMEDTRVRAAHRRAHGQVRPVGEPFSVGGVHMRFPGDPLAPAELTANCRCSLLSMSTNQAGQQLSLHANANANANESEGRGVRAASDAQGGVTMTSAVEIHTGEIPEDELPPLLAAGTTLPEQHTAVRWKGVLAPLGVRSGDNRMLAAPEDGQAVETRDLPLPLLYMPVTGPGHDGSSVVGRIDRAWVENGNLMGEGVFDLENDTAREVVRQIDGGYHRWVSVRVDKATSEYVLYRGDELVDASQFLAEDADVQVIPDDVEQVEVAKRWRLMNAALVSEPAFQEAVIGLVDDVDDVAVEGDPQADEPTVAASEEDDEEFAGQPPWLKNKKKKADDEQKAKDDQADGENPKDDKQKNLPPWLRKKKGMQVEAHAPIFAAMVASAGPLRPPAEWFKDPKLERPTALTVTEDGQIFGHAAVWGTPHVGYPGRRVTPPKGADYSRFHHGVVRTRDDRDIAVGTIVLGTDHAPVNRETTVAEAMAHYAHSGYGVAVVRAGEDEHGVWVSGAVCPDVDELRLAALRRCSLSGDWRSIDGRPNFISALAVNVPGFPMPREQTDNDGVTTALVAAGVLMPEKRHAAVVNVQVDMSTAQQWAREAFAELKVLMAGGQTGEPEVPAVAEPEVAAVAEPEVAAVAEPDAVEPDPAARVAELSQRMNEFAVERMRQQMSMRMGA